MGTFVDLLTILQSEWGWLVVTAILVYQLFWPLWETRFQSITTYPEEKFSAMAVVLEAIAEEIDDVDEEAVAGVFYENGYQTEDFKKPDDPRCADD